MALLTICAMTIREAVRRRLLTAVGILSLIIVGLTGWAMHKIVTSQGSGAAVPAAALIGVEAILVLLLAYMFSVVGALGGAFLAAPAIAGDVESGLVLAILPRPLRRAEFVLGKWLGLALLLAGYIACVGALELGVIRLVSGYVPPHPWAALAFLIAESLALLSVGILLSTRLAPVTSGVVAVVLFGLAWVGGIAQSLGIVLHNESLVRATTVLSLIVPSDGLWRAAAYQLEPAVFALAALTDVSRQAPFAVGAPPPAPFLWWAFGWVAAVLAAAVVSFQRRDL